MRHHHHRPPASVRAGSRAASARAGREATAPELALAVVREAGEQGRPADRVLRARLKDVRPSPPVAREAVRLVFAWYRWRGWAAGRAGRPDERALQRTLALAERFAARPESFDDAALAARALPSWLWRHMDAAPAFARALQREPVLWLRAKRGRTAAVLAALPGARAGAIPGLPEALRYEGAQDLFRTAAFAEGAFEIQDAASQAVGAVCRAAPGEAWWDACAGEGGKTLHLAGAMEGRGVVWAGDRSPARLAALRRRAARAGVFNLRIAGGGGGSRPPARMRFDGVLVDAPCTGIGTWGRNPHARWTCSEAEVAELAAVQAELLDAAAGALKPGGRLVYSVCTTTREETHEAASAFEARHPEFEAWPFSDPFSPGKAAAPRAAWWPQDTESNGMFVAAWIRRGTTAPTHPGERPQPGATPP
jgi:16S rRNA (cytosine967-C5)-methyltransferase